MLKYIVFYRQFITRRIAQLTRINDLSDIKQLPTDSIYHDISNINKDFSLTNINKDDQLSVTVDMNSPFINMPPKKRKIQNVTTFITGDLIEQPSNMKTITIGLRQQLKEFRSAHLSSMYYVNSIEELEPTNMMGAVVNYNPLFQNKIKGIGKRLTLHHYLMGSIINNISRARGVRHYIHIPLNEVRYHKSDFIRTADKITLQTIHDLSNPSYLMLMEFYNFVNIKATTSVYNKLDDDLLDNTHIIFTRDDKFIIYNLKELKTMNGTSNAIYVKLFNHINLLVKGTGEEISITTVDNAITNIDAAVDNNVPGLSIPKSDEAIVNFRIQSNKKQIDQLIDEVDGDNTLTSKQKKFLKNKINSTNNISLENSNGVISTVGDITNNKTLTNITSDSISSVVPSVVDKSMTESTIDNFDIEYMKKLYMPDILNVLKSFSSHGMILTDLDIDDYSDKLNKMLIFRIVFMDKTGKKHHIKFTLPRVNKDGTCFISGNTKVLTKQRINIPICKVSPTRVTLNSNFNKTMVEKNTNVVSNFSMFISTYIKNNSNYFKYELGVKPDSSIKISSNYSDMAKKYKSIVVKNELFLYFDYTNRFDNSKLSKDKLISLENTHKATFLGTLGNNILLISPTSEVLQLTKEGTSITTLIDLITDTTGIKAKPFNEYTELTLFNKKVPIIFVLAYRFGLNNIFRYLKVKYKSYDVNERINTKSSDIIIKFNDKKLVINKLPFTNSLIISGLNKFKLRDITFDEMNDKDTYYELLSEKGISQQYIKLIDDFYDYFIDPITESILFEMGEPTTFKDLLIRGTTLLTTGDHLPAASSVNYRFRSYERHAALIYGVIAKELSAFNRKTGGNSTFSINEFTIKQKAIQDPLLNNTSTINPIEDIKTRLNFSHIGDGGRSDMTMMIDDRNFTKDNMGIMSDASVDSSKVGVNAQLSMNANLRNLRGMRAPDRDGGNNSLLSISTMLSPGATQDDGKRSSFINIQMSHVVPSTGYDTTRVRTGMEKVIPYRTKPPFAYSAKDNGIVIELNDKLKLIKIQYKNGDTDIVSYGEEYHNNSAGGYHITQIIVLAPRIKVGVRVKKHELIAYNEGFFKLNPITNEVNYMYGFNAMVALLEEDATGEDSSAMTQKLADKLSFKPVYTKEVTITIKTNIHKIVKIGDHVETTDPLLVFDDSDIPEGMLGKDTEVDDILIKMNRKTPMANSAGKIVKIESFYKSEITTMTPSLAKVIEYTNNIIDKKSKFAKNTNSKNDYPTSGPLLHTDKLGIIKLEPEIVVLKFYIQHEDTSLLGSKYVYGLQLKSVDGAILPEDTATEDGILLDAIFSASGVARRAVTSAFLIGGASRVLIDLEKEIIDIYDA